MRRVFSVTPIHVGEAELQRRRRRYATLAPGGIAVDLVDIGPEAPGKLETAADLRASEEAVTANLEAHAAAGYDDLLPDCVLDPGLSAAFTGNGAVSRPQGMLRLAMTTLTAAGHRIAAVTRNAVIGEELHRKIREYGFDDAFLTVAVLDLAVEHIAEPAAWNAAMSIALRDLGERGATAVINGCSAVDVTTSDGTGPLVVDPAATALHALAPGGHR